jgi:hypothetical protein
MSSAAEGFASGREPVLLEAGLLAGDISLADFGLTGSLDISAR